MAETPLNTEQLIQNVISRYTNIINRKDWPRLADIFTEDAIWEAPGLPDARFVGRAAIAHNIPILVESSSDLLIQLNTPSDISVSGDVAHAQCTIRETGNIETGQIRFEAHGLYEDELRRTDGVWRFTHRTFVILEVRHAPLQGHRLF